MKKTVLRLVSGALVLVVLATGSVAVAAADKKEAAQKIEQAATDKTQQAAAGAQVTIDQLTARILAMQNRNNVVALLDKLVAGNRINRGEANQILKAWDEAHPRPSFDNILTKILQMRNRDNVVAVLDRLVGNGLITQGQSNQILKAWDDAHPNWQPPTATTPKARAA